MKKDEKGYIVVETVLSFTLFVLLNVAILSLINIVAVQARVHNAITQTAETLSMYCYALDLTGTAQKIGASEARAEGVQGQYDEFQSNMNGLISGVQNLNLTEIGNNGNALYTQVSGWVNDTVNDPTNVLQNVMNYGINQVGSQALGAMIRPLVGHYLNNGSMSGDEYLRSANVEGGLSGLSFASLGNINANSHLLNSKGEVKIIVKYDIDYTFGILPLPFTKLHVTQEVKTKAWLSGKGEGYTG